MVVFRERIYHKMEHLLRMANTPVLTDIEVGLTPFPIPDLFIGAPVVVATRYSARECPTNITIKGFNPLCACALDIIVDYVISGDGGQPVAVLVVKQTRYRPRVCVRMCPVCALCVAVIIFYCTASVTAMAVLHNGCTAQRA